MLDYFTAYEKHDEKETAVALPNKYGFYISYNDLQLKQRVYLDHRAIPLSLIKTEKKHKSNDVLITLTLKETVYKLTLEYKDYFKYLKAVMEPRTDWPEPEPIRYVDNKPDTIKYTGGYLHSKKDFRRYIDEFFLNKGITPEQLDIKIPDWRNSYY